MNILVGKPIPFSGYVLDGPKQGVMYTAQRPKFQVAVSRGWSAGQEKPGHELVEYELHKARIEVQEAIGPLEDWPDLPDPEFYVLSCAYWSSLPDPSTRHLAEGILDGRAFVYGDREPTEGVRRDLQRILVPMLEAPE